MIAAAETLFGDAPAVRLLAPLDHYAQALDKIRSRWADFFRSGWTSAELTACALARHGHHGLWRALRPGIDIGRVWAWCCELLCSPSGSGERSRLYHWRGASEAELRARHGDQVVPAEVVERRRERL